MATVILVIDDDPLRLATLGEALTTDDTTSVVARTGEDALREMRRGIAPDVVVIDLDMRDGYAVLIRLECAISDTVPVIALSSEPRRLLEAGIADAVLMKPFEVGQLRSCAFDANCAGANAGAGRGRRGRRSSTPSRKRGLYFLERR